MLGYFIWGTMAAFGVLCALWAMLGWLLPGAKGCILVCYGVPDSEILTRSKWLKSLGLLDVPLLAVVKEQETPCPGAELCSCEDLLSRLELERKQYHGTGNGDHSGRHQRCGVSEL